MNPTPTRVKLVTLSVALKERPKIKRVRSLGGAPSSAVCGVERHEGAGEVLIRSRGGTPSSAVGGVGRRPHPGPHHHHLPFGAGSERVRLTTVTKLGTMVI
jgi:hypothetical protein